MRILLFILVVLMPFTAKAQTALAECQYLTEHRADGNVAFKPGEGINGKKVVPADVNASPIAIDDPVVIPLTIDLARRLGNNGVRGLELETTTGFLEVSKDGRVTYNGRDLTPQVHALCGKGAPNRAGRPLGGSGGTGAGQTPESLRNPDRQESGDTLEYRTRIEKPEF